MRVWRLNALAVFLALAVGPASAGAAPSSVPPVFPGQAQGDFTISSFRFQDGASLEQLRLHYMTLGTPHRNAAGDIDNAVLLLHATGGGGAHFLVPSLSGPLYGPGEPLDLTKFYLIMPDAIGHGGSSKPSDGMRARFPHYGYRDIVDAQHALLTQKLGVKHLRLVLGLSMGCMHVWLWGERYPEMMDALVPIGCLPVEIGGRNRLWRHTIVEAIVNDPEWKNGDYQQQPHAYSRLAPLIAMMTANPERQFESYPTQAAADAWYDRMVASAYQRADTNDSLYQYDASRDYDPEPDLEKIEAKVILIDFTDDQINSPEFSVLDRVMPRVKHGRYVIIPASQQTNGEADDISTAELWRSFVDVALHQ